MPQKLDVHRNTGPTPGPWFAIPDPAWQGKHPYHDHRYVTTSDQVEVYDHGEEKSWRFVDDKDVIICTLPDSPDQAANQAAIAAVPKLLSACQTVVANWEHGDLAAAVRQCATAIAAAKGEA